jgi:hypothetical protein
MEEYSDIIGEDRSAWAAKINELVMESREGDPITHDGGDQDQDQPAEGGSQKGQNETSRDKAWLPPVSTDGTQQLVHLEAGARGLPEVVTRGFTSGMKETRKQLLQNLDRYKIALSSSCRTRHEKRRKEYVGRKWNFRVQGSS